MTPNTDRRTFIRNSMLGSAALLLPEATFARRVDPQDRLRIAILGSGLRGQSHIDLLLRREDCEVTAIADIDPVMIADTRRLFEKHQAPLPRIYTGSDRAWEELLDREALDAVLIATPWEWHVPMAVAALQRDLYTGLEVGGAFSVEECWDLVRAEEGSRGKLYFLENVCFRRDVMAVLRMVREGLFGEIIHLQGGYQHDLREVKFNNGQQPYGGGVAFGEQGFSEARWRTPHSVYRNGELYPTHGLGPVATMIGINRGNRMVSLTAMASKARGLKDYVARHPQGGPGHPHARLDYALGDVVTTMIQCQQGETILLQHDTNLPRPYSLGFRVQGTRGLWMDLPKGVHIEGRSPAHRWDNQEAWLEAHDHPLWKKHEAKAVGAGHGGMDWFLIHSFVEHARRGEHPPFDVYDAATWRVITPLSEQSIAQGSAPMPIPDFTRGRWVRRLPAFAFTDAY